MENEEERKGEFVDERGEDNDGSMRSCGEGKNTEERGSRK
jgi:hypothetical protein